MSSQSLTTSSSSMSPASTPNTRFGSVQNSKNGSGAQNDTKLVRDSILAGSAAGIATSILFHPFDVLRTKMQSFAMKEAARAPNATTASSAMKECGLTSSRSAFRNVSTRTGTVCVSTMGPVDLLRHTFESGGIRALYTGLSLPLAAQALYKSTVFTVNNVTKKTIVGWRTQEQYKTGLFVPYELSMADRFMSGAVGGAVNATLFVVPVEYVRNQLIAQHTRVAMNQKLVGSTNLMRGPSDVIKTTLQSNGILGLWRGTGVTMLRDSVGCGCYFLSFELAKNCLAPLTGNRDAPITTVLAGAVAGLGYWVSAMPLDTLKTLVQTGTTNSVTETLSTSMREEGLRRTLQRLYKGWQVAYARGSPAAAVTMITYDFCFRLLHHSD